MLEIEAARIYCSLSIEQFESLAGTYYWASEENTVGIYESKCDVLVFYRAQKLTEAILNDLSIKKTNKK